LHCYDMTFYLLCNECSISVVRDAISPKTPLFHSSIVKTIDVNTPIRAVLAYRGKCSLLNHMFLCSSLGDRTSDICSFGKKNRSTLKAKIGPTIWCDSDGAAVRFCEKNNYFSLIISNAARRVCPKKRVATRPINASSRVSQTRLDAADVSF
jgi:hypothetical protein